MKLSQHFSLGELTKSNHPEVYNIPSHTAIENLKRICENWLEDLRYSYNMLYVHTGVRPQSKVAGDCTLAPDPRGCALRGRRKMCARPRGGERDLGKTLYRFMGFPLVGVE